MRASERGEERGRKSGLGFHGKVTDRNSPSLKSVFQKVKQRFLHHVCHLREGERGSWSETWRQTARGGHRYSGSNLVALQ